MKKLFVLGFALLCLSTFAQKEWELIHGSNSSFNLSKIFITDTDHTWGIIGGAVYFSPDGGYSWNQQFINADYQFNDLFFVDNFTGWVVGWSEVLKTADGGESWTLQTLPNPLGLDVEAVYFLNQDTGWIAGSYKTIYVTYDGGDNWISQHNYELTNHYFLYDIHFYDEIHGCAVGGQGAFGFDPIIMTTDDGGENWIEFLPGTIDRLINVQFVNDLLVYACDNDGMLFRSTDGGFTWETYLHFSTINAIQMHFFNENDAIIASSFRQVITHDAFITYETIEFGLYDAIQNFAYYDENHGLAVGHNNFLVTSDGGYNWSRINERFYSIAFFNPMNGWIIQEQMNKNLMHSNDGGSTWSEVNLGQTGRPFGISFPTDETGYIISEFAELLKTNDAGSTWEIINLPFDSLIISAIQFLDENNGFMCDYPNTLFKTVDGGYTWEALPVDTLSSLTDMDFINPLEGWVIGWDGVCGHTKDGGLTWDFVNLEEEGLREINFIDEYVGIITSGFRIFRSANGGRNWQQLEPFLNQPKNIEFTDTLNGWITDRANVWRTYDGGFTWVDSLNFESANYQDQITDLFLMDSTRAWICTMDGRVFSYSDLQNINEDISNSSFSYYPNPVKDLITIEFKDEIRGDLWVKVFSINGKGVVQKRFEDLNQNTLTLNLSGLPAGLYLLNVQGSGITSSLKLVME